MIARSGWDWATSPILARYAQDAHDVRSLAEAELIVATVPGVDVVVLLNAVLAFETARRGRCRSTGVLGALDVLAKLVRDAEQGNGLTRIFSAVSRENREFRRLWIVTRVSCPDCGVGHLRVLRRRYPSGKVYRFVACSQFYPADCRHTEAVATYVGRKGLACLRRLEMDEARER